MKNKTMEVKPVACLYCRGNASKRININYKYSYPLCEDCSIRLEEYKEFQRLQKETREDVVVAQWFGIIGVKLQPEYYLELMEKYQDA